MAETVESVKIEFADGHNETFSPEEWRLVCRRAPIDCALRSCYGPDAKADDRCPITTFPSRDFHLLRAWLLGGALPTAYSDAVLLWHEMERWQIPVPDDYFWRWPEHWMGRLQIVSSAWCRPGGAFFSTPSIIGWFLNNPKHIDHGVVVDCGSLFRISSDGSELLCPSLTTTVDIRFDCTVRHKIHCTRDTLLFSVTRNQHSFIFWLPFDSTSRLRHHQLDGEIVPPRSAFDFPKCLLYRVGSDFFLASGFESGTVTSICLKIPDPSWAESKEFGRLADGTIWFLCDQTVIFCDCIEDDGQIIPKHRVHISSSADTLPFDTCRILVHSDSFVVARTCTSSICSESVDGTLTVCELFRIDLLETDQSVVRPFLHVGIKDRSSVDCLIRMIEGSDLLWIFGKQRNLARGPDTFNHLVLCDVRQGTVLWELHGPDEIRQLLPPSVHGFEPISNLMPIGSNLLLAHLTGFATIGHSDERPLFSSEFMHAATMIPE